MTQTHEVTKVGLTPLGYGFRFNMSLFSNYRQGRNLAFDLFPGQLKLWGSDRAAVETDQVRIIARVDRAASVRPSRPYRAASVLTARRPS